MPLYEYQCRQCGAIHENVFKIADRPDVIYCPCGGVERQNVGSAILRDEPVWLASAVDNLQDESERPITNRGEFNQYLKENDIVQR